MKVAIVGATCQTGGSVVNGLLASSAVKFVSFSPLTDSLSLSASASGLLFCVLDITALIRPASLKKPEVL